MSSARAAYLAFTGGDEGARLYNEFKRILYNGPSGNWQDDSLVRRAYKVIRNEVPKRDMLRVLDIGGSDGKRLRALIHYFRADGISVEATLVDPSEPFVAQLRSELERTIDDIKPVRARFERYDVRGTYDLALLFHSIFTFPDDGYVRKLRRHLAPDGIVAIASNDTGSLLGSLKQILDAGHEQHRREIDDALADFERNGFAIRSLRSPTAFGNCLVDGELTPDGKTLLSWLAMTPYDEIPAECAAQARSILESRVHDGLLSEQELLAIARMQQQGG